MWGCLIERETAVIPRRESHFVSRAAIIGCSLGLIATAWLIVNGVYRIVDIGDLSAFAGLIYPILVPLTLVVVLFTSMTASLLAASHEKDRKTLDLLILSRLSNAEIVFGKAIVGLLVGINIWLPTLVVWFGLSLFGGVSHRQIVEAGFLGFSFVILGASWGAFCGLWRDKTFQALATCVLGLVAAWIALEISAYHLGTKLQLLERMAPSSAIDSLIRPVNLSNSIHGQASAVPFSCLMMLISGLSIAVAIWQFRTWNSSKRSQRLRLRAEPAHETVDASAAERTPSWRARKSKQVWSNPVLWREACTWAYGRKIIIVKLAYIALSVFIFLNLKGLIDRGVISSRSSLEGELIPLAAQWLAPFSVLSLAIINALAVTSIANERDGQTLDLVLASEISPAAFLFGKIAGVLYAAKEMVALPLAVSIGLSISGAISMENTSFICLSYCIATLFVVLLGIRCGMIYSRSRSSISVSLGTIFFLFVGVLASILVMVSFRGSFERQLPPFLGVILGGGTALYAALVAKQPSAALAISAYCLPFLTFFAVTSFLLRDQELTVFSVISIAYGFTTVAMLIPALSEFQFSDSREAQVRQSE
jgi:ABC-type transport system involved in multi-copper enzyme maturation permease subunit